MKLKLSVPTAFFFIEDITASYAQTTSENQEGGRLTRAGMLHRILSEAHGWSYPWVVLDTKGRGPKERGPKGQGRV